MRSKIVIDTNILISAAIYPNSTSAQALLIAVRFCDLYRSDETTAEIEQVLLRSKFDRYFGTGNNEREKFLNTYRELALLAPISVTATECSDPKDNKFLSLCLSVQADILVSGDRRHLLPMHPYQGIDILSEADFVNRIQLTVSQ